MSNVYHFIGIGAGVANLSIAALLQGKPGIPPYLFLDEKSHFSWHKDSMYKMSEIQTDPIKDIVTPAEPTSPYSFLNYLHNRGIIYHFFANKHNGTTRKQFNDYLCWVSKQLSSIKYNTKVESLKFDKDKGLFEVQTDKESYWCKHVVLGCGIKAKFPSILKDVDETERAHHTINHLKYHADYSDQSVAIIGGGQSGAEAFYHLVNKENAKSIAWFSKRSGILSLEDSSFTNELYMPDYVSRFYELNEDKKILLNERFLTSSDGITRTLSDEIYNLIYNKKYFYDEKTDFQIYANREITNIQDRQKYFEVTVDNHLKSESETVKFDRIIYATGFESRIPDILSDELIEKLDVHDNLPVNKDYSLEWSHGSTNSIYIQNASRHAHGLPDPNISLAAWRASVISNSLLKKELFKIDFTKPLVSAID